jgi:hypothetical protein
MRVSPDLSGEKRFLTDWSFATRMVSRPAWSWRRAALDATRSYRVTGNRLDLLGDTGVVASLEAK